MATNNASRPTSAPKTPAAARKAAPKAAAARPASARATAARPASRAKATSKSKGPGPLSNLASSHRSDLVGIGWAVLAVLVALGTYTKFIGPFGNGVTWLGGVLVGIARFALPILFALPFCVVHPGPPAREVGSGLRHQGK
jgi:hypothetical protein